MLGDCLEHMKEIPDGSVDMVLTDPPYGTTPLTWDSTINSFEMWKQIYRVAKPNAGILLFGQEPFASMLRCSNIKDFKYDWYWVKERLTNVFQVKRRPGKVVENILVFYKEQPTYNPQKTEHTGKLVTNKIGENAGFSITQGAGLRPIEYIDNGTRHPLQILNFKRDNLRNAIHPTQKPVELLEYLIKTYTNENETILDFTMGSGSTGVACLNTNRNFIGIEMDENYFNSAKERINTVQNNLKN